jgi:enoyl-CoA hydratase/carnithine racemase
MTGESVLYEVRGAIAVLTLNRPERLNALTDEMQVRYMDLLDEAAADPDVRVIVVTGAGRGFCAGADVQLLQDIGDRPARATADGRRSATPRRPVWRATTVPKPVIAAINGACAGLGLVHALLCDLRFAADGAKLTTAFARRGLVAEHGVSWVLPRLVGPARALDLLLSGRTFLADEAAALGLVNAVVPPERLLDHTFAFADELATWSSPSSMAAMKRQVWGDSGKSLAAATADADVLMAQSFNGGDFKEGVASYVEKRPPHFAPLERGWATGD